MTVLCHVRPAFLLLFCDSVTPCSLALALALLSGVEQPGLYQAKRPHAHRNPLSMLCLAVCAAERWVGVRGSSLSFLTCVQTPGRASEISVLGHQRPWESLERNSWRQTGSPTPLRILLGRGGAC